jgi:NlpC/P60 family putative phage cell wall peptidase
MTTRAAVIAEALSWLGTPFHDCASVKGAGVDCLNLIKAVYVNCGLIEDFVLPPYKPQYGYHRSDPLFLKALEQYAHRVERPEPGDVAMFWYGRQAAHSGIVIDAQTIVHAFSPVGRVTKGALRDHSQVAAGERGAIDSYWSVFP